MSAVKRIEPRRPYHVTPEGRRRIVLGEVAGPQQGTSQAPARAAASPKPLRTTVAPQRWYMAVVQSDRGRLDEPMRQAIAAAAILASPDTGVLTVVLGDCSDELAASGADLVAVFPDLEATRFQPEREVAAVAALLAAYDPDHVFMPDTLQGTGDLGRRLIASHDGGGATHVVELDSNHVAVRWCGGAALASRTLPRFVLLEPGAVEADLPFVGAGRMLLPDGLPTLPERAATYRDFGLDEVDLTQVALEEAGSVVSAGRGVENVATLARLAEALGAAVGASRVAVDEDKLPRDRQIGATGKSVSASLYVAVGISGAVQHLQGIKDCQHVVAINRDVGAPIVKRADLTVIGDAEELMQALVTRIGQARAQREQPEA